MKAIRLIVLIPILMLLTACGDKQVTGAIDVRWDREICARCAMAVSDPKFAAQVRDIRPDGKAKIYKFDSIGCAVIWLDKQSWGKPGQSELWVNDNRTGEWIDARTAWYVQKDNTPMGYGLGAQTDKISGSLNFTQAREQIYTIEKTENIHGGSQVHLLKNPSTSNPNTTNPDTPKEKQQKGAGKE